MANEPRGREKNITGNGKDIHKRGEGLGTGPVGENSSSNSVKKPASDGQRSGEQYRQHSATRASSGSPLIKIILAAVLLLGGGGYGVSNLLGGSEGSDTAVSSSGSLSGYTQQTTQSSPVSSSSGATEVDLSSLLSGIQANTVSSGWTDTQNTESLNTTVSSEARAKRTNILGGGKDTVTIMVYMCGTDLESKSSMGTSDLMEMTNAKIADNVNLIVYTGGCKRWNNSVISSSVNQIYKVESGGLRCLVSDAGKGVMTNPTTLSSFIKWCNENYPANRNDLIFWDHGGGSLSGYGYDEKNASSGSMTLKGINEALSGGGVTFDFIGFDACLMATLETALMLDDYADYLIASEETEPGVGWYYTDWLTKLSANTSMSTLDIGKNISDDFVRVCAQKCPGQKTTLSVVDLAELAATVPADLSCFSASTIELLQSSQYDVVSNARSKTREFASSSRIDQVDLVHLAHNMGTDEGKALADTILKAVKYNVTSSNMTNAYGLSIYFPYQRISSVDSAVATYEAIGMDSSYARCIQQFASIEAGGQAASGGMSSPLSSLLGGYLGGTASSSSAASTEMLTQLLEGMMGGSFGNVSGLTSSNTGFLGRSLDVTSTADFISGHNFDSSALSWQTGTEGKPVIALSAEQWSLVHSLDLNVFFDDGEGYIDLGNDNVYSFTDSGALIGEYDGTWIAINDQPVAYYHIDTFDDGTNYSITGRVPVMLNGSRADLILVFDNENPYGYIAGANFDYKNGETDTIAKNMGALNDGDVLEFVCDYYSYDGDYLDSFYLGEAMTVKGDLTISNVYIDDSAARATYRFSDIYGQVYWTEVIPD